jgi:LysM repeat protein
VPVTVTATLSTPTGTPTIAPTVPATPVTPEPTPTPVPAIPAPLTYTLQRGEFPYCIARRFNVDPIELLALSRLGNQRTFFAGTVLTIPQTGNPFPGNRMLLPHPAIHVVSSSNETIFGVACVFGDVDPMVIAQANNLAFDASLYPGQQLNIP